MEKGRRKRRVEKGGEEKGDELPGVETELLELLDLSVRLEKWGQHHDINYFIIKEFIRLHQ